MDFFGFNIAYGQINSAKMILLVLLLIHSCTIPQSLTWSLVHVQLYNLVSSI